MTYPIAEACFEDKDFLSFFASDEPMLAAEIVHNEGNFGYAARLKYSKTEDGEKITFWSKATIFRVRKPGSWVPFEIVQMTPVTDLVDKLTFSFTDNCETM